MTIALVLKRVQLAATAGFRNDQASPATSTRQLHAASSPRCLQRREQNW